MGVSARLPYWMTLQKPCWRNINATWGKAIFTGLKIRLIGTPCVVSGASGDALTEQARHHHGRHQHIILEQLVAIISETCKPTWMTSSIAPGRYHNTMRPNLSTTTARCSRIMSRSGRYRARRNSFCPGLRPLSCI